MVWEGRSREVSPYPNRLPHAVKVPAASTIHAVLDRHGLVKPMGRRCPRAQGTPLSDGLHPNDLWSTDYKGEFMLADKRYCYPLTVTDHASGERQSQFINLIGVNANHRRVAIVIERQFQNG